MPRKGGEWKQEKGGTEERQHKLEIAIKRAAEQLNKESVTGAGLPLPVKGEEGSQWSLCKLREQAPSEHVQNVLPLLHSQPHMYWG